MADEAQSLLDGLTIKYVHFKSGTPPFYIHHCYGTTAIAGQGPVRRMNALLV